MATAAEAAKEFATGPQVIQAARLLLEQFPVVALCEALANAKPEDAGHLQSALERLVVFEEVRSSFLSDEVIVFLQRGAEAENPVIRGLVATLLSKLALGEDGASRLSANGLLQVCASLLVVEETGTAEAAARVMISAVLFPACREAVLAVAGTLQGQLSSLPDVQRMRALQLFIDLGKASDEAFEVLEAHGAYRAVLGVFITDDLLLKLTSIELMDALGSFPRGQGVLSQPGVPEKLLADLEDPMCEPSVRLCVAGLLGRVLLRTPDMLPRLLPGREAPLAQTLAGLLESRDAADRLGALAAWADISEHVAGLAFFLQWDARMRTILGHVTSTQNEVAKGAMAAWAQVLRNRPPPRPEARAQAQAPEIELWEIAERQLLPAVLKNLTGKPFPDVRKEVWQLMALLVQSRAAATHLVPSPEMRELLLDFTSEQNSEARHAKHAFVVALQRHVDWFGSFLDEPVMEILAEFARQGPHWQPRNAAAMVGEQGA